MDVLQRPLMVSYSRAIENQFRFLDSLRKALPDVELFIDQDLKRGENFHNFIRNIGLAKNVLVILSDEYFRSFYCLTELLEIYKNFSATLEDKPGKGVFFIRHQDYRLDDHAERTKLEQYWNEVHVIRAQSGQISADAFSSSSYTPHGSLEEITVILENLRDLINWVSPLNTPTCEDVLNASNDVCDNSIREWLKKSGATAAPILEPKKRVDHEQYLEQVKNRMGAKFAIHSSLVESLSQKLDCVPNPPSVTDAIVNTESYALFLNTTFRDSCWAILKSLTKGEKQSFIEDVWDIVSWLKALFVSEYAMQEIGLNKGKYNISADTDFGESVVTNSVGQALSLGEIDEQGNYAVHDKLFFPRQPTWESTAEIVDDLILSVYRQVMSVAAKPNLNHTEEASLSFNERRKLNAKILGDAQRGQAHFHCVLNDPRSGEFMKNPEVALELQRLLPAFDLFWLEGRLDVAQFFVEDEAMLGDAFLTFLRDIYTW
ncbi:MAG: TIR domain-containing protein [Pseudomonadota bacterium]